MILLYVFLWVVSGIATYVYFTTLDEDVTTKDLTILLSAACMGPFILVPVIGMYNDRKPPRVLFKKREPK